MNGRASSQRGPSKLEAPVVNDLPFGTVVDVIVQNNLNETIPLYKHGVSCTRPRLKYALDTDATNTGPYFLARVQAR